MRGLVIALMSLVLMLTGCAAKYASPEAAVTDFARAVTAGDISRVCSLAIKEDQPECESTYGEIVSFEKEQLSGDWAVVNGSVDTEYSNNGLDAYVHSIQFGNGYGTGGIALQKQAGTWRVSMSETFPS